MGSRGTRSSPRSRTPALRPSVPGSAPGPRPPVPTSVLFGTTELDAVAAELLRDPPVDIGGPASDELVQHLEWLAVACSNSTSAPSDESGALLVLRRRIVDHLRARLLQRWAEQPPEPALMLEMLTRLERAAVACVPAPDQTLAAELADCGGLDLVVEVAHDMRSPLTSILFLSEILHSGQSGTLSPLQKRQVGIVYSAALGLVGMTSDMIEMARDGGRLTSHRPVPFSINDVLRQVQGLVQPTAEEKRLELRICRLESERRIGLSIPLGRVLLNLTSNALKYTTDGSVELGARAVRGSVVEFYVADTGPGIAQDELAGLYHAFRREPARKTGYYFSGTGLGLGICRRLVSAMGSELELVTAPGEGTRFSFRLDLPPASRL
jgi:signal transduction histidine kinase